MLDKDKQIEIMQAELGKDNWKKVGAIFRILEIGSPNIAQSEQVLDACKELMKLESVTGY